VRIRASTSILIFLILVLFQGIFVWIGGYWENAPLFDRLSGPMRFRQFVADPIPDFIHSVRGGYSGFPQGQLRTQFSFTQAPQTWPFLVSWSPASSECVDEVRPWVAEVAEPQVYQRSQASRSCSDNVYLILDSRGGHGVLFME
jgi:hypothetical protein